MHLAAHLVLIPDFEDIPYDDGVIVYEGDVEEYAQIDDQETTKIGYFKFCIYPVSDMDLAARMSLTTEGETLAKHLHYTKGANSCLAIHRLEIYPRYRRAGHGLTAMKSMLAFAKRTGIAVAAVQAWPFQEDTNHPSERLIGLWEQAGFQLRDEEGVMTRWL